MGEKRVTPGRIEVLTIGDELLDGRVADTNTLRLAQALAEVGAAISQRTTVADEPEAICAAARACIDREADLCVVCGGLGPTSDDVTAEAFAALAGVELVRDAETVARIEELLASRGREIAENQRRQADRPGGAELLPNPVGTAVGFSLVQGGCRFVCLPGVPRELDAMVERAVVAPLRAAGRPMNRRELRSFGLMEGEVDRRLESLGQHWPSVRVGFRTSFPEIRITLTAPAGDDEPLRAATAFVEDQLGWAVFSQRGEGLADVVLAMLRERGATLATAESCTGGLVADLLTDVPGSSDVFLGAVCAYHNDTKVRLLGVYSETLGQHGPVSEPVVIEMARGARERVGADWAVAVSGVAGPGGGTPDKPVGTVWLAVAGPELSRSHRLALSFDRRRNKVVSAYAALNLLRRSLS